RRLDPVADHPLRGLAGERAPPRQLARRQRLPVLVEDLEAFEHILTVGAEELGDAREADGTRGALVGVHTPPVRALHDDALVDRAHARLELLARVVQLRADLEAL